jgi:cell division protein FtsB
MIIDTKKVLILLFIAEIVIIVGNFLYAENGLPAILTLQQESGHLKDEIQAIKKELATMEEQLAQWDKYPFYKEKIAREQLHMIRDNEIVYFNV